MPCISGLVVLFVLRYCGVYDTLCLSVQQKDGRYWQTLEFQNACMAYLNLHIVEMVEAVKL